MLTDQEYLVLIKVLKYEIIIEQLILDVGWSDAGVAFIIPLIKLNIPLKAITRKILLTIKFLIKFLRPLLYVIKGVERIHKLHHTLRILLLFR